MTEIQKTVFITFVCLSQNFAAQMSGGYDEKAGGGAQMGVMQGPMVSKQQQYLTVCRLWLYLGVTIPPLEVPDSRSVMDRQNWQ